MEDESPPETIPAGFRTSGPAALPILNPLYPMRLPSSECPHCGARLTLPDAFARRCVRCGNAPRPLGLWFAMPYAAVAGIGGVFAFAALLAGVEMVDEAGRTMTGLAAELFPLALFLAMTPGALLAYGLFSHRGWTRPLLFGWLIWMSAVLLPVLAAMSGPVEAGMSAVMAIILFPVAWLYLYRAPAVIEYYAAIARRDEGDGNP